MNVSWFDVSLLGAAALVLLLTIVACILGLILGAVRMGCRRSRAPEARDEARMMQEIHQGLTRMEERLETLETLIPCNENEREASKT